MLLLTGAILIAAYGCFFMIGSLLAEKWGVAKGRTAFSAAAGLLACLALLEVGRHLLGFLGKTLQDLTWFLIGGILLMAAASLVWQRKTLRAKRPVWPKPVGKAGLLLPFTIVAMVLLPAGIVSYADGPLVQASREVMWAVRAAEQNSLLPADTIGSSWLLYAILAHVTGAHPAALARSVMPFITIPVSYCACYYLGLKLFKNKSEDAAWFLFFVTVIQLFSARAEAMEGISLLLAPASGAALYLNVVFVMLLALLYEFKAGIWPIVTVCTAAAAGAGAGIRAGTGGLLLCLAAAVPAVFLRITNGEGRRENGMGFSGKDSFFTERKKRLLFLLVCLLFAAGTVFSIVKLNNKINTLYIAARDLEAAVHEQVRTYELREDGDGEIVGAAFRLSEGSLIIVNGGDEGNASYLREWISDRGGLVSTWYITDKKLSGACRELEEGDYPEISIKEVIHQKGR